MEKIMMLVLITTLTMTGCNEMHPVPPTAKREGLGKTSTEAGKMMYNLSTMIEKDNERLRALVGTTEEEKNE